MRLRLGKTERLNYQHSRKPIRAMNTAMPIPSHPFHPPLCVSMGFSCRQKKETIRTKREDEELRQDKICRSLLRGGAANLRKRYARIERGNRGLGVQAVG